MATMRRGDLPGRPVRIERDLAPHGGWQVWWPGEGEPPGGMGGIDPDNCRNPETGGLSPRAAEDVRRFDTYAEVDPSGTGVRRWASATLPPQGRKRGEVEVCNRARFFPLPSRPVGGRPARVAYRPDAVAAIHREVFGDAPEPAATGGR